MADGPGLGDFDRYLARGDVDPAHPHHLVSVALPPNEMHDLVAISV